MLFFWVAISLIRSRATLLAENALLRHQIDVLWRAVPRPRLRRSDRLLWFLVSMLCRAWREWVVIVRPETVVGWHRLGVRLLWRWKSRGGRPRIQPSLRELIARIARENPLWGIPRIRAELALLGHCVARSTISKYAGREFGPPSQTWSAFIRNHMDCTAAMDFFTVPTVAGGLLYCFVVLAHDRRRVRHYNVTRFPTASWVARQLVQAFPFDTRPQYLIHDNDGVFGEEVTRALRLLRIEEVRTSPGSPWMNAFAERFIGSVRRECLDHVIVFNERHLLRLVGEYVDYHHTARPHESLDGNAPEPRPIEKGDGPIVTEPMVGGLHHRYRRAA